MFKNPLPWSFFLIPLLFLTMTWGELHEVDFVSTQKNPLIRLRISLKEKDIGVAAEYGENCNQTLYDKEIKPMYDGSLTIYEASDRLLTWLARLSKETKENPSNTLRKDTCGANHLMGCLAGVCKCLGETTAFPNYSKMKPTIYKDPNDPSVQFTECRVTEGGLCNVRGLLFCDDKTQCDNDYDNVTKSRLTEPVVKSWGEEERKGGPNALETNTTRCICKPLGSNPVYINNDVETPDPDPANTHGVQVLKIPKNSCTARTLKRPRAYQ